jgi:endonuclease G, mitochondrial
MKLKTLILTGCIATLLTGCIQQPNPVPPPQAFVYAANNHKTIACMKTVAFGFPYPYVKQEASSFVCHEDGDVGYALEFNPRSKVSFWVTEHLTKDNLEHPDLKPLNDYRQDPDFMSKWQPTADDYKGSGFNYGYFASLQDFRKDMVMFSKASYFVNLYPQDIQSSEIWNRLENNVRIWAMKYGEVYVISGPVYANGDVKLWLGANKHKNIAAPTHLFKVIYAPKQQQMIAFVVPNAPTNASMLPYAATNVNQVEQLIGYDLFPLLPQDKKGMLYNVSATFWPME